MSISSNAANFTTTNKGAYVDYRVCQTASINIGLTTPGATTLPCQFDQSGGVLELNNNPETLKIETLGIRIKQESLVEVSGTVAISSADSSRWEGSPVITIDATEVTTMDFNSVYHRLLGTSPGAAIQSASINGIILKVKKDELVGLNLRRAPNNTTTGTITLENCYLKVRVI